MIYLALIHQDEPRGEFWVSFPDCPGCVCAAKSLAEVKALVPDVLLGHIEAIRAEGLALPDPSTLGAIMQHEDYVDSLAVLPVQAPITAPV